MMIGVAHVIGMKPTLISFFSIAPPCAKTSVAVESGKNCDIAASAVEAPSVFRNARRATSLGNMARMTAEATTPSKRWSSLSDAGCDCELSCGMIVLGLAPVVTASAPALQLLFRIKGVVENGHDCSPCSAMPRERGSNTRASMKRRIGKRNFASGFKLTAGIRGTSPMAPNGQLSTVPKQ